MNPVLHSSKADDWRTPQSFLELVRRVAPIAIDPATEPSNPTRAEFFYAPIDPTTNVRMLRGVWTGSNGLDPFSWTERARIVHLECAGVEPLASMLGGLTFVNPPYGRALAAWADRISHHLGETIVLAPSRTDTRWFRTLWSWCDCVCFLNSRLCFERPDGVKMNPAPFPNAVFYRAKRVEMPFGPQKPKQVFRFHAKVPDIAPFTSVFASEGLIAVPTDA